MMELGYIIENTIQAQKGEVNLTGKLKGKENHRYYKRAALKEDLVLGGAWGL